MTSRTITLLIAIGIGGLGQARSVKSPALHIAVRFYNLSEAPASVLRSARASATRILNQAGVQLTWVECTDARGQWTPALCDGPVRPDEVILRIVREPGRSFAGTAVGVAFFDAPTVPSSACVFYQRIEDRARLARLSASQIFGAAIAHELGHLLLSDLQHARSGLMRAYLDNNDLQLAAIDLLFFTREEERRMRVEISRRLIQSASN